MDPDVAVTVLGASSSPAILSGARLEARGWGSCFVGIGAGRGHVCGVELDSKTALPFTSNGSAVPGARA